MGPSLQVPVTWPTLFNEQSEEKWQLTLCKHKVDSPDSPALSASWAQCQYLFYSYLETVSPLTDQLVRWGLMAVISISHVDISQCHTDSEMEK